MSEGVFLTIKDKLIIEADINLLTGMHIGASNDFSPIGTVDSVVIKDPITKEPIIPGSSIKGKLRTLISKLVTKEVFLPEHDKDDEKVLKLFGSSAKNNIIESKLQFYDLYLTNADFLKEKNLDLGYTEIKFENTIDRLDAKANPRQLERVPAGAIFKFKMIYNLFNNTNSPNEDFELLANGIKTLQLDYLGGSGTRGYGKVSFSNFTIKRANLTNDDINVEALLNILKESENIVNKLIEKK